MSYARHIPSIGLSYDDVCILQQRMRQGYSGLGDAGEAYTLDHARWVTEKSAYDKALSNWAASLTQLSLAYARAKAAYEADLAKWKLESAAYQSALIAYNNQARTLAMTYGISQNSVLAQYPSIVIPPGYAGCVTQAQRDAWLKTCNALNSVRGLGAVPTGPECGLALLPVCQAPLPPPTALRPVPQPPAPITLPTKPPALRPEPQAPAAVAIPTPGPSPGPSAIIPTYTPPPIPSPGGPLQPTPIPSFTPTPIPSKPLIASTVPSSTQSGGLLSNGLVLIVIAGGGYALYRTLRKPKAA